MTRRQSDLLAFLRSRASDAAPPSYDEMAAALGLTSRGNIQRLVDELARQGHIVRDPARARSIRLVDQPLGHIRTEALEAELRRRGAGISWAPAACDAPALGV